MKTDYLDIKEFSEMMNPQIADASVALEFLLTVKSGIRNCAFSLTETATPEARAVLRQQLEEGLAMHEELSKLMMKKGWLHPYEVNEQFHLDNKSAETVKYIAGLKLFPDNTSRLGMYATPEDAPEKTQ